MECSCIGTDYDGEGWDIGPSETYPIAKKNWTCCECREKIPKGEKYSCYSGKTDGRFIVYRTCLDCRSVTNHLFCGWTFECVWDDVWCHISDTQGEISWEKVSKLTPIAREKVCAMVEKVWKEAYYD